MDNSKDDFSNKLHLLDLELSGHASSSSASLRATVLTIKHFSALIEHVPFPMRIFQPDGLLVAMNRAAEHLTTTPRQSRIGQYNLLHQNDKDQERVTNGFAAAVYGKSLRLPPLLHRQSNKAKPRSRKALWCEILLHPVHDDEGRVVYVVETTLDATDRIRKQRQMIRLNRELKRLNLGLETRVRSHMRDLTLSREKYRMLIESQTDFVVKLDVQANFLFVSPSFCVLLACDNAALLDQSCVDTIHEDDRDKLRQALVTLEQAPHRCTVEWRVNTAHGQRWLSWAYQALLDQQQRITSILGTGRDVTEQKEAQAKVDQLQANLRDSLHMGLMGFGEIDLQTWKMSWDKSTHILHGTKPSAFEPTIENYLDLIHDEDRHRFELVLETVKKGLPPSPIEYRIVRPDGTTRWIYGQWHIRYDQRNQPAILFGINQDINRRKVTEQQLQKALDEVRAKDRQLIAQERLNALGQMSSGVVHDFNNALQPIILAVAMLEKEGLHNRESFDNYIHLIKQSTQDASSIVKRLSRFYKPSLELEIAKVNVCMLVDEAIALTRPKWQEEAQGSGCFIQLFNECEKGCFIAGIHDELRDVLINMIFNAVDAIESHGIITLKARKEAEWIVLEVIDTGAGMSEEVRAKCLEPFYTTKTKTGSGLGLSIVYGAVQHHRGTIAIDSAPGKGTAIRIRLPIFQDDDDGMACSPEQPLAPEPAILSTNATTQLRILVVDNECLILDILEKVLLRMGHQVHTAESGKLAWDLFNQHIYDLVLTDQAMPEMTGEQLAMKIKASYPNLPVILLTGFGVIMQAKDELPNHIDSILSKPIEIDALLHLLQTVERRED